MQSPNPKTRIVSDFMNPEAFIKAFNLTNCSDLFKRFVFISSEEITSDIAPDLPQNPQITEQDKSESSVDADNINHLREEQSNSSTVEYQNDNQTSQAPKSNVSENVVTDKKTESQNDATADDIEDFFFN